MKLIQKHPLKGSREFEIVGNEVKVRIKTPFKNETFTEVLSILNPEPIVNKSYLEFHSRVKCGPLLSLFLDKPNAEEFNAFVDVLKQRALEEYNVFAGLRTVSKSAEPTLNPNEEPGGPEGTAKQKSTIFGKPVDDAKVENTIRMLEKHLDDESIKPFLSALEALRADPENVQKFTQLVSAFNDLGEYQGAVLTYAPYIGTLLSADPLGTQ